MQIEDKFLPGEESDSAISFERMLSNMEEIENNIISLIEITRGEKRKLYFRRDEKTIEKGKNKIYWLFLGSSLGNKTILWEKYNLPVCPNQYLPDSSYPELLQEYNKKTNSEKFEKSKAI